MDLQQQVRTNRRPFVPPVSPTDNLLSVHASAGTEFFRSALGAVEVVVLSLE